MKYRSLFIRISILVLLIVIFTSLKPAEATLSKNVQVVYLHGAWWIQLFFGGLILLLVTAWQIARGFKSLEVKATY